MNASENETRILITGAYGFVGRHLIAHLLAETHDKPTRLIAVVSPEDTAEGHEHLFRSTPVLPLHPAVAFLAEAGTQPESREDLAAPASRGEGIVFLEVARADLTEADAVTELLQRTRPSQIYHLTANSSLESESSRGTDSSTIFGTDVQGTRILLEAASHLSPFPRILLAGDGCVYGSVDPARPAREEDPIGPLWRYGAYVDSRIEIETSAKAYRALAITARTFTTVGPGQSSQCTISGYARQLARIWLGLQPPQLTVGSLEVQRDLLDVRDVVRAYRLLMAQGECGEAYNISTGKPVFMRTIVERLCLISRATFSLVNDPARSLSAEIACSTGDTLRTWAAIGWQPRRMLDETLNDLIDYWLETEKLDGGEQRGAKWNAENLPGS